ncbi:phage tail tube protein [Streptomyces phaeochromogenes]
MANEDVLVMGPATLYIGAFGATEPLDSAYASAPASGAWTNLGYTTEGAELNIEQDYKELVADQVPDKMGARLEGRSFKVKVSLAEPSLENLAVVLNDGIVASGSGYHTYEPAFMTSATQPTYRALLIDGWASGGGRMRLIVRKVLSTDNVKFKYSREDQTAFEVEFEGFYVDDSTAPWHVVAEDAD